MNSSRTVEGLLARRAAAIAEVITIAREEDGTGNPDLLRIQAAVQALALRSELFPTSHFPLTVEAPGLLYLLHQDDDGRFALYVSPSRRGAGSPVHNHTTWAVIAGIAGYEHQFQYERTDDGSDPSRGDVRLVSEVTIGPGGAASYGPEELHAVEIRHEPKALMIHLYGRDLEQLSRRIRFEDTDGGKITEFGLPEGTIDPPSIPMADAQVLTDAVEISLTEVGDVGLSFDPATILLLQGRPGSRATRSAWQQLRKRGHSNVFAITDLEDQTA